MTDHPLGAGRSLPPAMRVVDSHTEGEPTRVVIEGWSPPAGATMAQRLAVMRASQAHLRTAGGGEPGLAQTGVLDGHDDVPALSWGRVVRRRHGPRILALAGASLDSPAPGGETDAHTRPEGRHTEEVHT